MDTRVKKPWLVAACLLAMFLRAHTADAQGMNWRITGNGGTDAVENFVGTTDEEDFVMRTNDRERVRIESRGNVGINEDDPGSRLVVRNDSFGQRPLMSIVAGDEVPFHISSSGTVRIDPVGSGVALRVRADSIPPNFSRTPVPFHVTGANNVNAIYVARDGDVGIGTAGEGISDRLRIRGPDNDGSRASVRIVSGSSQQTMLLDGNEIDGVSDGLFLNHNSGENVVLATGGGDVGIGTSAPDVKLHVRGSNDGTDLMVTDGQFARMRMVATNPTNDVTLSVQARGSANTARAEIGTVSSHDVAIFTNGIPRLLVGSDGNVCIGNC